MAATLNSIINKRAKLTIPLDKRDPDAGSVTIVYRPKAITPRKEKAYHEAVAKSTDRGIGALLNRFSEVVIEWDLRWDDADSEPVAIKPETLMDVPSDVLSGILNAINEDQNPDPPTENA